MGLFVAAVLIALLRYASTQDANCDFTQDVVPGQKYLIYSPGYPNNYSGARQCRWLATAPANYQNVLECPEIDLPYSLKCSQDRLLISRSGDPQLLGAQAYCDRGSLTAVSTGTKLSVGFITPRNTTGGRFYCELRAQLSTTTPTPPTCSCGYKKQNRIVGGVETGVNEYPMMAGVVDTRISSIKCGGTIIDQRYVLTAAHCLSGLNLNYLAVVVGEHDVNTGDSPATQGFNVEWYITHPQYNPSSYDNDIAILRLDRNIVFSDRVGPACLPFRFANSDFTGRKVTLLGWGTLFPGGPTSNTLQKVDVDVISQASCQRSISTLTPRQFCTYTAGKDSCQDDSGGPALLTDPQTNLLYSYGIISFGRFCASDTPAVNTRVSSFLSWIENNTPGANYCRK